MTAPANSESSCAVSSCAVIAHRGASRLAPENTLGAVRLAWELGSDGVEIDIRLSRDGVIVAMHDAATDRTTGASHAVVSLTAGELQQLNAAARFGSPHPFEGVPRLSEILATVPPGRRLVVEIKDNVPEILGALEGDIRRSGLQAAQVTLITFDYGIAVQAKRLFPAHEVLWLISDYHNAAPGDWPELTRALIARTIEGGLDGLDVGCGHDYDPSEFLPHLRQIRVAGLKLLVWTVNDPAQAALLRELPVDGITTDVPDLLLTAVAPGL